jgi:hypothetical protein
LSSLYSTKYSAHSTTNHSSFFEPFDSTNDFPFSSTKYQTHHPTYYFPNDPTELATIETAFETTFQSAFWLPDLSTFHATF